MFSVLPEHVKTELFPHITSVLRLLSKVAFATLEPSGTSPQMHSNTTNFLEAAVLRLPESSSGPFRDAVFWSCVDLWRLVLGFIKADLCKSIRIFQDVSSSAGSSQLRRRMNIELNFAPNSEGLVLGCIDADFCK